MTPEQWSSVEAHFAALAEATPEDQVQKLASIEDPTIRAEVASLLVNANASATETGVMASVAGLMAETIALEPMSFADRRIGPYRLVRRLGQGGQGTVFEAVRDDGTFHQRVAIKVIKWEMDTVAARERFRQERQILARIEHPYVARLLDGGQTEDGAPYLVMEFVHGQPLAVAAAGWSLRRKLAVFLKVCEAVEHAHRNLVVHRDLKPANILVTENGDPKLLDFGIAKLLDPEATRTQTGSRALTPDYASPEQVRAEPITTASDVYSLGVILYQLLTGRKPYTLDTGTPAEMDRVICLQPPAPPAIGDELDYILLTALRKEPERRYGGVLRFAEDIESYLQHRPVAARPDTIGYRAGKFLRRHWASVAVGAALLASITAGLGFSLHEAHIANTRFQDVRALATTFLFDFDKEISTVPGNTKARQMLAATAQKYLDKLAADARNDYELLYQLAVSYQSLGDVQGMPGPGNLGLQDEGAQSYRKAIAILERIQYRNPQYRLSLLEDLGRLARMVGEQGHQEEALELVTRAAKLAEQAHAESPSNPLTTKAAASTLLSLATILASRYELEQALEYNRKSVALYEQTIPAGSLPLAYHPLSNSLSRLSYIERGLGDLDAAEKEAHRVLQLQNAILARNPNAVSSRAARFRILMNLAEYQYSPRYPSRNNWEAAARQWEEEIALIWQIAKADPHDVQAETDAEFAQAHLTSLYLVRHAPGDLAKADLLSESMIHSADVTLEKAPKAAILLSRLPLIKQMRAAVLVRTNRCDAAIALSRDALQAQRRLGANTPDMRLDLTGPLLRHAGIAVACGQRQEAVAARDEAFKLIDGLSEQNRRYLSYAYQAANYTYGLAADLEAAAAKSKDKELLGFAIAAYDRATSLLNPWQQGRPIVAQRFADATAGRDRCSR